MKKCLLATVIMMAATAVYAEPTAMLKVHGTLTSAGCVPEISNGGVADFGEVGLDSLSSGVAYQAGHKDVTLTITCQSATRVGWTIKDDRKDSNAGAHKRQASSMWITLPQAAHRHTAITSSTVSEKPALAKVSVPIQFQLT